MDKLMLLYFLLSGADIFSFKVFGNTIRIVNVLAVLLVFSLIILKKYQINRQILKIYFPIIIIHFISIFYSISPMNSLVYLVYVIFYLFFTLNLIYSWGKNKNIDKIIEIYIVSFRIVSILTIIQFFLGNLESLEILSYQINKGVLRPALWFYEPSYLATYLSIYYMLCFSLRKKYLKDFILSILTLFLVTSSTGYIAIVMGIILYFIFDKEILRNKIKKIFYIILFFIILLIIIFIFEREIVNYYIGRLFKEGILNSSGERKEINIKGLIILKEHFFWGIGTNSILEYMKKPPMNVLLEIFISFGIIFGNIFLIVLFYINFKLYKIKNTICKALAIAFLLYFIVLQANQNYMRMYMWNHIGLMLLFLEKLRRKNERKMAR